jgi:hypothetical protein
MRGDEILREVRRLINDTSYSNYSDIQSAYEEICRQTEFFWLRREDEDMVSFQSGTSEYLINLEERIIERVWVYGVTSSTNRWILLDELDQTRFEEERSKNIDSSGNNEESRPIYYKLKGINPITMVVTPSPDQAYQVRVDTIRDAEVIERDTIPSLPSSYHRTLAKLAAGYILERKPDPVMARLGEKYIADARATFINITTDSHPNRIDRVDWKPRRWIK